MDLKYMAWVESNRVWGIQNLILYRVSFFKHYAIFLKNYLYFDLSAICLDTYFDSCCYLGG